MLKLLSTHGAAEVTFPEPPADGDPIALAIVLAVLAIFAVWVIIDKNNKKKLSAVTPLPEPAEAPATVIPKAPGSAGNLKLYNVEPKTAAMIMAIVANKMNKPLNELRFLSIKEVE